MTRTILIAHLAIREIDQRESGETGPDRRLLKDMVAKAQRGTVARVFAQ
jgi:hypothetical protein